MVHRPRTTSGYVMPTMRTFGPAAARRRLASSVTLRLDHLDGLGHAGGRVGLADALRDVVAADRHGDQADLPAVGAQEGLGRGGLGLVRVDRAAERAGARHAALRLEDRRGRGAAAAEVDELEVVSAGPGQARELEGEPVAGVAPDARRGGLVAGGVGVAERDVELRGGRLLGGRRRRGRPRGARRQERAAERMSRGEGTRPSFHNPGTRPGGDKVRSGRSLLGPAFGPGVFCRQATHVSPGALLQSGGARPQLRAGSTPARSALGRAAS